MKPGSNQSAAMQRHLAENPAALNRLRTQNIGRTPSAETRAKMAAAHTKPKRPRRGKALPPMDRQTRLLYKKLQALIGREAALREIEKDLS